MAVAEVSFYSIVVFAHVLGAVAGLGVTFVYPSGSDEVTFSDEFVALYDRLMRVAALTVSLVVVAVFFMAVKP